MENIHCITCVPCCNITVVLINGSLMVGALNRCPIVFLNLAFKYNSIHKKKKMKAAILIVTLTTDVQLVVATS